MFNKKEYDKKRYLKNSKRIKENSALYKKKNIEKVREYNRKYNDSRKNSPIASFHIYKSSAKTRKIIFELSFEEFKYFWRKECYYCGSQIKTIGLDRVDNKAGYILDNIVPCCIRCNKMKMALNVEDFIGQCKKIAMKKTKTKKKKDWKDKIKKGQMNPNKIKQK